MDEQLISIIEIVVYSGAVNLVIWLTRGQNRETLKEVANLYRDKDKADKAELYEILTVMRPAHQGRSLDEEKVSSVPKPKDDKLNTIEALLNGLTDRFIMVQDEVSQVSKKLDDHIEASNQ